MHVELIGLYIKSIRQQQPGGAITNNNGGLSFMTMIDPFRGCFEIVEVPTYDLDDIVGGNY